MAFGIVAMLLMALALVFFFLLSQQKLNKEKIKTQALELLHQQELLQHNLTVQEEERQRIAAQLHDDIGSKLGVLNLTVHRLRRTDEHTSDQSVLFEELNGLIAHTLDATRRISHELLPPTLEDFGLGAALVEFCEGLRKTGAVDIQLDNQLDKSETGNSAAELHLFRIVQELTNNTLKYAKASQIRIELLKNTDTKQLIYTDNGLGFDPESATGKGLGMKNLENRVKMLPGNWHFITAPEQGFKAIIEF